ncbi:PAS domain-containing protein [Archangium sp.]|uniref:PAS domain-containing protein n=1 Tax=Archangium sp. TaxID=1872627 RepID=UPI002D6A9E56|nr:PAS domain-containing protein [Archangium sp.]HYO53661.1 PAS domain-containing protein [Archangium sp.]
MAIHEPPRTPTGGPERRAPSGFDPLLDGVTDGILMVDGAWRLVWLNAVFERLLGRSREQLLEQELWSALPEVADSAFAPAWRRAMDARTLVSLEDFFAPGGVWLESRAFPSGEGLVVFIRDVTERRLAENERVRLLSAEQSARTAVEGERARFQEMLMLAPVAVSITRGPEHRFVFSNLLHRRFHGSRDMVGQSAREALPELASQGVFDVMDRVYASGNPYVGRARPVKVSRPGGSPPEEMFFDIAYHPQRDAAGRVEGVAIFAYDVTDLVRSRRTAEALARELGYSEERFRSLVTATSDIIWATPPSGEFVEELPGWSAFTGQTHEEYRGWGWLEAVHPEDRERTARAWQDALSTRTSFQLEYRLRHRDGSYRRMLARAVPVMEKDGSVREWVGAHRDITRQRQGEAELERLLAREQRHAQQLQGLASAALVISEADSIEHVLEAITEQAREVIGAHQSVTSLTEEGCWARGIHAVSMSDKYAAWRDWDASTEGSGIYTWVCRLNLPMRLTQAELEAHPAWRGFGRHKGKHPPLRGWLAAPLVGRDGRNLGLIQLSDRCEGDFSSEDEAILVQLARMASVAIENTRLMAETQAANRAKDEVLAVMSHELRTPLTAVLGWTQMLRSRQGDTKAVDKGLAVIERNARTLAQLIEDVLDVSRIITGKLTLHRRGVELVGVVQAAVEVVRPHAEQKGVAVSLEVEVGGNGTAMLVGDPGRLQQVCWNLLVNAVKFTPAGGQVHVRVERSESELCVRVTDTGKGIRADFLPHLFERFWQADGSATREHGGLGLGLAIVHHLVGLHGGSVRAESAGEGKGSTFTVTLPVPAVLPEAKEEALPGAEAPAPEVRLDGVTVLLVEDAADARELIALMLRERGAVVCTASNGAEAMERLGGAMPDVLVSDIGLPGEDGHTLLRKVRAWAEERDQWVPAIALTAYASAEDARRAYRAGFQVHMAKPLEPAMLIEAVARLAGRGDAGAQVG